MPFLIIDCAAPKAVIEGWLAQRQAENEDPSDATMEVIEAQLANREPLTDDEKLRSRHVETNLSSDLDKLVTDIRQYLPGL
jgi:predicted kinase